MGDGSIARCRSRLVHILSTWRLAPECHSPMYTHTKGQQLEGVKPRHRERNGREVFLQTCLYATPVTHDAKRATDTEAAGANGHMGVLRR